jgi:hypothetical protein
MNRSFVVGASALARGCLALALLCAATFARGDARVSAHLSSGVVRLGDRVSLIVTVENANQSDLRSLPTVDGLTLGPIGQPADRISESWINGVRSRSATRSWIVPVRPSNQGEYTIPSFDVLVEGQPVKTSPLVLTVVADMKGEELGFLELRASSTKVVEGQPFSIEVLCGFDQALGNDVNYYNLALPWWGELPGVLEMEAPPSRPGAKEYEIDLNGRERIKVEMLDPRTVKGKTFYVLRVVRSFTPTRVGAIEIPTSFFEFGKVIERRDFFQTHREKGETFFAKAADMKIDVVPLPDAGRPLDFSGAIGALAVKASAEPRDVDAGESIKFKVEWSGSGNLEFFTPPDPKRIDAFRGFRVYGKIEEKSFEHRTVTYDIAPISSEIHEIPALPMSVFDPAQERYKVVASEPIPIRVRALEGATGLAAEKDEQRFAKDIHDIVLRAEPAPEPTRPGAPLVVAMLAITPAGWLALRTAVRRRGDPNAPAERARRKAKKQLSRSLQTAKSAREQLDVVYAFLAARTRETPQAWIGRGLDQALAESTTLDKARVQPLFDAIAELERSAWGGRGEAQQPERIVQAAEEAVRGGL